MRPPSRATFLLWPALLGATVLAVFSPSIGYEFCPLDDDVNLLFNPHLGPPTLARFAYYLSDSSYIRRYQPLGSIAESLVAGVSGISPWGYHALNVLLHALNAVLLYRLIRLLLKQLSPASASAEKPPWLTATPLLAAAWWALNPLRVELVAWPSGIPVHLSMTFTLLALTWHAGSRSGGRQILAVASFAAGLLSYPVSMGATAFFPLLDWAAGSRGRRLVTRALPYVAITLAVGWINLTARAHAGVDHAPVPTLAELPAGFRVLRGLCFIAHYWWKPWLPFDLAPVYSELLNVTWRSPYVLAAGVLFAAAGIAAWRRPAIGLLLLAQIAVLLPITGFTELLHFPHDRYAIWSDLSFATGLAFLLWQWRSRAAAWSLALLVIVLAGLSVRQLPIWATSATVAASVRSHLAPGEATPIRDIRPALWLFRAGSYAAAEALLDQELSARPNDRDLIVARLDLRDLRAAHERTVTAMGLRIEDVPPAALIHQSLAARFLQHGEPEPAAWHLAEIARIAPAYYAILVQRAALKH